MNRTNAQTKCSGLFNYSHVMLEELELDYKFMNDIGREVGCNRCIGIIPKYKFFWTFLMRILVLFINICVLISFNADTNLSLGIKSRFTAKLEIGSLRISVWGTTALFTAVGITMGVLTIFLLLTNVVSRISYVKKAWIY